EAVVEVLAHVALRTRLVLVVDDLHWVDPASSKLLRYVANKLGRAPILLVVTYRAEDAAGERDLIAQLARLATRQIALTPLAEDSSAEMAEILLGPDASPADVRRIARDADGNPLFVEELVAARGTTARATTSGTRCCARPCSTSSSPTSGSRCTSRSRPRSRRSRPSRSVSTGSPSSRAIGMRLVMPPPRCGGSSPRRTKRSSAS